MGRFISLLFGAYGMSGVAAVLLYIYRSVSFWLLFEKIGIKKWHAFVPVLHIYDEYKYYWKTWAFAVAMIAFAGECLLFPAEGTTPSYAQIGLMYLCGIAAVIFELIKNYKFSKSFGYGYFMTLLMIGFPSTVRIFVCLKDSRIFGSPVKSQQTSDVPVVTEKLKNHKRKKFK